MIRRVPLVATLVVLAAVATMIALGFWQLDRLGQKQVLLARYRAAQAMSADAPWPGDAAAARRLLYRHATLDCREVVARSMVAGRNSRGQAGMAEKVDCRLPDGAIAPVVLGWSRQPVAGAWAGGRAQGVIAPGPRLVADPPLGGLEANARPDPSELPNNHLAYAVQWFLFAATATVIYAIALWKRLAASRVRG